MFRIPFSTAKSNGSLVKSSRIASRQRPMARRLRHEPLEQRTLLAVGSISGTVFEDLDRDGVQDLPEELGLSGWTVELLSQGGGTGAPATLFSTFENPSPTSGGRFGRAMTAVGDKVLVTADKDGAGTGAAYLFDSDGQLDRTFKRPPSMSSTGYFGWSAVEMGGNVLIGDRGVAAYLFDSSTGDVIQTFLIPPGSDGGGMFGNSVAVLDNSNVVVGDPEWGGSGGAVYVFDSASGECLETILNPSPADFFGWSVAALGNDILVGAASLGVDGIDGQVHRFNSDGAGNWSFDKTLVNPMTDGDDDLYGYSITTFGNGTDGYKAIIGAPYESIGNRQAGIAYLFDCDTGALIHTFESPDPNPREFGYSVAAASGNILIGAPGDAAPEGSSVGRGAAYVFDAVTGDLLQTTTSPRPASAGAFGNFVGSAGDRLLVSDWYDDTDAPTGGIAYSLDALSAIASDDTDGVGGYTFGGVAPGVYQVSQVVASAGYVQTFPGGGGAHTIVLGTDEQVGDINFGSDLNSAPVAVPDSYTVDENITLNVAAPGVLANDTDLDLDSLSAVLADNPAHGNLTLNSDGSFTYDVTPGFVGTDTFTYKAYDGLEYSNATTVSIEVHEIYGRTTFQNTDTPKEIRDRKTTTSTITVPADQSYNVIDLNVKLDITHGNATDLEVFLTAPDGTRVELFSDVGGAGDNFIGTTLDDEVTASITAGSAPFSGVYRPEGNLSAVDGQPAAGTWTLEVFDDSRNRVTGTLDSWAIEIAAYLPPAVPGITVGPTAGLATAEDGSTDTFTVVLDSQPAAGVTIAVSSSDPSEGTVSPATLSFDSTNWSTPQTVTVTGVDDPDEDGNVAYTIVLDPALSADPDYSGRDPADVAVTNLDNDAAELSFQSTDVPKTIADPHPKKGPRETTSQLPISGTGATVGMLDVDVTIVHPTMSDVTVSLTSPGGLEKSLAFVDGEWNLNATTDFWGQSLDGAWVLAATDNNRDGVLGTIENWSITVSTLSGDPGVTVTPISGLTTSETGDTATFMVVLNSEPTGVVMIHLIPDDTTEGELVEANSDDQTLIFDPGYWWEPQYVTVIGVDDSELDGDVFYDIIITVAPESEDPYYWAINPDDVTIINLDDGVDNLDDGVDPAQLLADFGGAGSAAGVTSAQLQQVASQALALWSLQLGAPLEADIQLLLADLPEGRLGEARGHKIVLDGNANGAGWFVDPTPWEHSEFLAFDSLASGRVDLLTVVTHEIGHTLGFEHSLEEHDVMAPRLGLGTRRLPGGVQFTSPLAPLRFQALDELFAAFAQIEDTERDDEDQASTGIDDALLDLLAFTSV